MREIDYKANCGERDYNVKTRKAVRPNHFGFYKQHGYIKRLVTEHPKADKRGYVMEHRLMMEQHLGRFLKDDEVVHHKDGVRDNNDLNNLELLINQSKHASIEMVGKRNTNGQRIADDENFKKKKYRLYDKDRNTVVIYDLQKLIRTTFRRGCFEYRGEWTGLKDKNGKEIYEGDIVNFYHSQGKELSSFNSVIEYKQAWCGFYFDNNIRLNSSMRIEVIGNIYDHPHLLEGNSNE